jgi:hypothetical protein
VTHGSAALLLSGRGRDKGRFAYSAAPTHARPEASGGTHFSAKGGRDWRCSVARAQTALEGRPPALMEAGRSVDTPLRCSGRGSPGRRSSGRCGDAVAPQDRLSVARRMADRAAVELARVAVARPALGTRCERAAGILAKHVVSPRRGLIRAQLYGGELVGYLVRGSGGAVYRVEAKGSWRCSCPDHHGRHRRRSEGSRACKHGLACWALWRAAVGAPVPAFSAVGVQARRERAERERAA